MLSNFSKKLFYLLLTVFDWANLIRLFCNLLVWCFMWLGWGRSSQATQYLYISYIWAKGPCSLVPLWHMGHYSSNKNIQHMGTMPWNIQQYLHNIIVLINSSLSHYLHLCKRIQVLNSSDQIILWFFIINIFIKLITN